MRKTLVLGIIMVLFLGALIMVNPTKVLAANGPSNSYNYIKFYKDGNTKEVLVINTLNNSAQAGATYDKSTNTLTLSNLKDANLSLEVNEMGDDFKLKLVGSNSLKNIVVWGFGYGGSLNIVGSGTLDVHSEELDHAIALYAESSAAKVDIAAESTINLYAKEQVIGIYYTTYGAAPRAIELPNSTDLAGGESVRLSNGQVVNFQQVSHPEEHYKTVKACIPYSYANEYTLFTKTGDTTYTYGATQYESFTLKGVKYENQPWMVWRFIKSGNNYLRIDDEWEPFAAFDNDKMATAGYTNAGTTFSTGYTSGIYEYDLGKDSNGNEYVISSEWAENPGTGEWESTPVAYNKGNSVQVNGKTVYMATKNTTVDASTLQKVWQSTSYYYDYFLLDTEFHLAPLNSSTKNIAQATVTLAYTSKPYTGSALKPGVTVVYEGKTLTLGTDYTVSYANNVNVGEATVTVTGKGEYSGTNLKKFTITKAEAKDLSSIAGSIDKSDATFTGANIKKTILFKDGNYTLKEGTDYTVTYKNNRNVGTATITISGKGNYKGTLTRNFKILALNLSKLSYIHFATSDMTYCGSAIERNVILKNGNTSLVNGTDYTVTYKNNVNVGTATITATGKGNYGGSISKQFKILQRVITSLSYSSIPTSDVVWTGSAIKRNIVLKLGSLQLKEGTHYTATYNNNTNIGKATIVIAGKGNFKSSITKTFMIIPKAPTNLRATKQTKNTITIGWNKPASGATAYRIYMYNSSTKDWEYKQTTDKTSATISNLQTATAYIVKVCAYVKVDNKLYKGPFTSNLTWATIPETPSIKTLASTGNKNTKQLKLEWSKSTGATGYEIAVWTSKSKSWSTEVITGDKNVSRVVSGLVKDKLTYKYKVRAYRTVSGKKLYTAYSAEKSIVY